ncbi:MAG TPA: WD40 repeat domain-containing protein [Actinoplanes sp.]|nr:WD40 repeat domain-containing protein [Actinoplanes sp.]
MFVAAAGTTGHPLVIACEGAALDVIDPATATRLHAWPTGIDHVVRLVAADLGGRPGAIVAGRDTRRAVDLTTGAWISLTLDEDHDHDHGVRAEPSAHIGVLEDTVLTVRDRATGEQVGVPVTLADKWVRGVATGTLDGRPVVAVAAGTTVTVHDLATAEPVLTIQADDTRVDAVAVSGTTLITAGLDTSVRLFALSSGEPLGTVPALTATSITAVTVGHVAGRPIVLSGDDAGAVQRWDVGPGGLTPSGGPLSGHDEWVRFIAITELDGITVAVTVADQTIRRWDLSTGAAIGEPIDTTYGTDVFTVARWNGMTVGIGKQSDNRTRVWNLATGELVAGPLADWAASRAFAELDGVLYSVTEDHPEDEDGDYDFEEIALQAWDLGEGDKIGEPLEGGGFGGVVMHPPVTVALVGGSPALISGAGVDGVLRVRDLHAADVDTIELAGHEGQLAALATAVHDGRTVAVTGGTDGTVRVWDLTAAAPLGEPRVGHLDVVDAAALAEIDGTLVAVTGGRDGTVRLWPI